jgi:hypothetical protein
MRFVAFALLATSFLAAPASARIDNIRYSAFTNRIPEPAVWMMMIAGFGMVGAAMRRRAPRSAGSM